MFDAPPDELRSILNGLPAMVGHWDRSLRNTMANDAYVDFFGFTPSQMHGIHISEVLGEELFRMNLPHMERALAGEPQLFDREIVDPQGRTRYTQTSYVPDVVDDEVRGFFVLVTDITWRRVAEMALEDERRRIATVLDAVSDAVVSVDLSLIITVANRAASEMLGIAIQELIGRDVRDVVPVRSIADTAPLETACLDAIARNASVLVEHTCDMAGTGGIQARAVDFLVTPSNTALGECDGLVIAIDDVTASRQLLQRTLHRARHDPLTGLPNREYLATIEFSDDMSVLFCDLDGFKRANDTFGHHVGDDLLREVAEVLRRGVRIGDHVIRHGGDEFIIVLPHCHAEAAFGIAEQLAHSVVATRFAHLDAKIDLGISIGVASPGAGADKQQMIDAADQVCYSAKRKGGSRVETAH